MALQLKYRTAIAFRFAHDYTIAKTTWICRLFKSAAQCKWWASSEYFLTDDGRNTQARVAEMQKGVACQTGMQEKQFIELRSTLHELIDTINLNQPDMQDAA